MIQITMQAILENAIPGQQLQHHYLYLVSEKGVVLYVGQGIHILWSGYSIILGCCGVEKAPLVKYFRRTGELRMLSKRS